jgi:ABC-2 type transport system permease protein
MRKAFAVGVKEFRQIVRDRRTLSILMFIPAFFLLLFGYALNFDVRNVRLAVEDDDRSTESRQLISAFTNSGYFDLAASPQSRREIERLMDLNAVRVVLVIPENMGRDVREGRRAFVQLLVNGDNANTATTVVGYALTIVRSVSADLVVRSSARPAPAAVTLVPRVWYNPELRSALFLVPGLIAYIAMITAVVSTALSVVREKERGTMEQVRMSPVGPLPYVLGKSLPYFAVSLVSALIVVFASMALFGLPMRGSWAALLLAISLFLIGALGLGLLVSTMADSQQVAFQVALLLSFLPTIMLSGFIFPIASMPAAVQVVTTVVPARYFLVALRGIVLKGSSVDVLWRELAALVVFAAAVIGLAAVRLRREWRAA